MSKTYYLKGAESSLKLAKENLTRYLEDCENEEDWIYLGALKVLEEVTKNHNHLMCILNSLEKIQ